MVIELAQVRRQHLGVLPVVDEPADRLAQHWRRRFDVLDMHPFRYRLRAVDPIDQHQARD
jgi:hypothetical protein